MAMDEFSLAVTACNAVLLAPLVFIVCWVVGERMTPRFITCLTLLIFCLEIFILQSEDEPASPLVRTDKNEELPRIPQAFRKLKKCYCNCSWGDSLHADPQLTGE